ncbi:very long chain fatty acid elongase AAEL008004-like [Augochlora pura]
MESPVPLLLMTFAYLYFVLIYGPRFMKDRKPYSFRTFIYWYNIFQIFANAAIVYNLLDAGWYSNAYWRCTDENEDPYSRNPYKMTSVSWYALCLKIIDFTETILFVLRKKTQQISFLHVYHHVSTALIVWGFVKYVPNGFFVTVGGVNSIIHVIMYSYYLLASHGPKMQKLTSHVKPLITMVQMVQFVGLMMYSIQYYFSYCPGMKLPAFIITFDLLVNLILFSNFYRQTYAKKEIKVNTE